MSKKSSTFVPDFVRESRLSNGIKAITSDFGSENLGSIPGWTTKKSRQVGAFLAKV